MKKIKVWAEDARQFAEKTQYKSALYIAEAKEAEMRAEAYAAKNPLAGAREHKKAIRLQWKAEEARKQELAAVLAEEKGRFQNSTTLGDVMNETWSDLALREYYMPDADGEGNYVYYSDYEFQSFSWLQSQWQEIIVNYVFTPENAEKAWELYNADEYEELEKLPIRVTGVSLY